MVQKLCVFLVFGLLSLSACSSEGFILFGNSENWSATLEITELGSGFQSHELELQYKGSDIDSVGQFAYNLETNAGGFGEGGVTVNEDGLLLNERNVNSTNAKVIKNSEAELIVEWDGNTETIILK